MANEGSQSDIQKDYSKIIKDNFVINAYVKGMTRFLILWIIKYNDLIHGYAILKEVDKFFETFIDEQSLKKSNPSNIYPILNKMEELGLISSEYKLKNNRKMKYFKITEDGEYVLEYIYSRFDIIHNNSQWKSLFEDMD